MSFNKVSKIREDYNKSKINFDHLAEDPILMFNDWFQMAVASDEQDAICFVLSTVSSDAIPSSRIVLLREINKKGFVFFTNYNSSKSKDISTNSTVSANFFWKRLEKQVRIIGSASKISEEDSDRYFDSRPRKSQLAAWASDQSSILNLNYSFMKKIDEFENIFKNKKVDRPLHWGGYCIVPEKIEFWQGRPSRLHDRLLFLRDGNKWIKQRLSP